MTTLGIKVVHRDKKFVIYRHVAGDLSHGFNLVPASSERGGYIGIGFGFGSEKEARQWMKKARKYGYSSDKFQKMYDKHRDKIEFDYLSFKEAKPFLKDAYGDKADEYRKKLKKVM